MMLALDRIMIKCSHWMMISFNEEVFEKMDKFRGISYSYKMNTPFYLRINISPINNEVIIEFTGKILGDSYANLINVNNVSECLNRIQTLNICKLDVEGILRTGKVLKCDVTRDIPFDLTRLPNLISDVRQSLRNYDRWHCDPYANGAGINGATIYNTAVNPKHKRRMVIYDKSVEMRRADNNGFIRSLSYPDEMMDYFADKVRMELNLYTMAQIRTALNISDNNLMSVLTAEANPIADFIDKALTETDLPERGMSQRMRERLAFVESLGCDMQRVEAAIRETKPRTVAISRAMKPYREAMAMRAPRSGVKRYLMELVA